MSYIASYERNKTLGILAKLAAAPEESLPSSYNFIAARITSLCSCSGNTIESQYSFFWNSQSELVHDNIYAALLRIIITRSYNQTL